MSDKSLDEKKQEFGENDFGEKEGFGAENVESYAVENDAETVSVSSSNKRIKEMSIDRLSALPDGVLIHILSFLWSVKEAAITSVLSKRWQFLWSELPRLRFREDSKETEKIREFVAMVSRTLLIRSGIHLEKFKVCFMYDESFASDIDIWVEFAVKNKVKEVSLQLNSEDDLYTLPEIMYFNSSLRRLSVRGCLMDPLRIIEWKSLTSLDINDAELPQHVIENILTSCPVLHSLVLGECWGFNCLEVNSQNLYKLKVHDREDGDNGPLLEISAPYICTLDILFYPEGRKLQLRNITSIVRADFDFTGYWFFTSDEVRNTTKELFEIIKHVKELELGRQYFKVLSELAVNGWQLPKSMRRCLTVVTFSEDEHNISGILALLESSPNLESLVIEGFEPEGDTWDQTARGDLNCDLLHLKTIKISDFADPIFGGEPMLTLARILLKRATVLEEMAIRIRVEDISDFIKMGQILLTYPRSSEKAVIRLP